MKNFLILYSLFLIVSCSSVNSNNVSDKTCGIDELLSGISCIEPDYNTISKAPLGSKGNPVRVDGPQGQREYLSRLVCNNGEPVSHFRRLGSAGASPFGFITDIYLVLCDTNNGVMEKEVYLDMYHKDYEENAPASGFISLQEKI